MDWKGDVIYIPTKSRHIRYQIIRKQMVVRGRHGDDKEVVVVVRSPKVFGEGIFQLLWINSFQVDKGVLVLVDKSHNHHIFSMECLELTEDRSEIYNCQK
jgi:hypothetical protein